MVRNIQNNGTTLFIGQNYMYLPETQSTNLSLKLLIGEKSVPEGTVISTGYQSKGKGQAGAVWESGKEQNIMLSVLLHPKFLSLSNQFGLSKAVALAVYDFVSNLSEPGPVKIKWPNDILVFGQKICGILIENGLNGEHIDYSIIGIGININEIFSDKYRTSLKTISGLDYDLRYLENLLFSTIEKRYLQLKNKPQIIEDEYVRNLYGFGERMLFNDMMTGNDFDGIITGIHPDGRLIIETDSGTKIYNTKEVGILRNNDL